jgi:hypothetical protein
MSYESAEVSRVFLGHLSRPFPVFYFSIQNTIKFCAKQLSFTVKVIVFDNGFGVGHTLENLG